MALALQSGFSLPELERHWLVYAPPAVGRSVLFNSTSPTVHKPRRSDTGPHVLPVPGVLDGWCREGLRIVFGCLTGREKSREMSSLAESGLWSLRQRRASRGLGGRFVSAGPSPESSSAGWGWPFAPPSSSWPPFLAVLPSPSLLEATPRTAPKTATTDDPSSAVFLRTLEPFHSRIVNDRSEWGLNKTFQLLRKWLCLYSIVLQQR